MLVDALGNPVRFRLTGGQEADVRQAPALLMDLGGVGAVLGDKAYDAQPVLDAIEHCGATAVIPPKVSRRLQRTYDKYLYRARADIERFFQRLKQFRRLATRYDKLAQNYQAFLALASTIMWLL